MINSLSNKYCSFIFGFGFFNKLVVQCFVITVITLVSNSNALAIDGIYNGDHTNLPDGWTISSVSGLGSRILHAGDDVADDNNLTTNRGNGIDGNIGAFSSIDAVTDNIESIRTGAEIITFETTNTSIFSGYSTSAKEIINNNIISADIKLTDSQTAIYGGELSSIGYVASNSVDTTSNRFTRSDINISGGESIGDSISNNIDIKGTDFSGTSDINIYGGYSGIGHARNNIVSITDATFSSTGDTNIYGGYTHSNGVARNNKITITDAIFSGANTTIYGGYSTGTSATNNHITINDGYFKTNTVKAIIGGQSDSKATEVLPALNNNTITLNSTTLTELDLSGTLITGGQHGTNSTTADIRRKGNRLVIKNKVKVGDVRNFEYYDFYMNKSNDDAPLTSTGSVDIGENAVLKINIADNSETIKVGSFIELIRITGDGTFLGSSDNSVAIQSVSFLYALTEHKDIVDNIYGMTVTSVKVNPLSTAFVESRLASFSFMNQANSLILGQGINSAMESIMVDPSHWALFTALSGVYLSYDTDVNNTANITGNTYYGGSSFMLGIAKSLPIPIGDMLTGIYFETGIGVIGSDINTEFGYMNTDGNTQYYGGGALLRYSMDNGFYTEGFFRVGILSNDLQSRSVDMIFDHGSTSIYAGIGVNFGYELTLFNARDMFDVYTNYTWGHLNGYNHIINNHDYEFNSINSHQVAVGVQYIFIKQHMFSPFIGVAAEYEFDAGSTATIDKDYKLFPSNLSGITGVAEVGLRVIPMQNIPLTMAFHIGGNFGRKEGIETSFDLEWRFGSKNQSFTDEEKRRTAKDKKQAKIKEKIKKEKEKEEEDKRKIEEDKIRIEEDKIEKEREAQIARENQNIEAAEELQGLINDAYIKVESVEEGVAVHVGELLFKTESYELTNEGEQGLVLITNEIKNNYPNKKIVVRGHSDSIGYLEYNQLLSEQRAETIANKMKESLHKKNISYEGKAFTDPIAPNATTEGRAKNRRVEIIIELNPNIKSKNNSELQQ